MTQQAGTLQMNKSTQLPNCRAFQQVSIHVWRRRDRRQKIAAAAGNNRGLSGQEIPDDSLRLKAEQQPETCCTRSSAQG